MKMDLFAKEINQKPNFTVLSNWLLKSIGVFVSMMSELAEIIISATEIIFLTAANSINFLTTHPSAVK